MSPPRNPRSGGRSPVGQPAEASDRIAECGRTRPALDGQSVAVQKYPGQAQVDGGGRRDPATEDDLARRGVVGDGVGELHPPVRDAAVDDLDPRAGFRRLR